ncbi:2-keto-4-pentenoate hydratase [Streptomyces sp. uw30]|uniref:2-keto-4-pentenoate hydratase n=1 Tax=Streptomyces sp. uw30 TaxID=1828179 RepID=UPI0021C877BC|nr:hypothetical protein [Streptomyces sp. uw30]
MSLTYVQHEEAGRPLREAEHHAAPIDPLSALLPGLDLSDAYAVQRDNVAWRPADGATVIGPKVGLTAPALRGLLGVDEPDFGHLPDDTVLRDGTSVFAAHYCRPRIEPEVCFHLAEPLSGPGITVEDVLRATDAVAPALGIVDSRIRDWRITLVDTVADNANAAGPLCGPWTPLRAAARPHRCHRRPDPGRGADRVGQRARGAGSPRRRGRLAGQRPRRLRHRSGSGPGGAARCHDHRPVRRRRPQGRGTLRRPRVRVGDLCPTATARGACACGPQAATGRRRLPFPTPTLKPS